MIQRARYGVTYLMPSLFAMLWSWPDVLAILEIDFTDSLRVDEFAFS